MISVVIPAYNEEDNIAYCLDAFLRQTTKRDFEVILVNNASTDRTAEIAHKYSDKLNLNVILDLTKGRGHARYVGFNNAKGEVILSSDSDTVVPDNWIETLASILDNNLNAVAVTGTCKVIDLDLKTNKRFNQLQPLSMRIYKIMRHHYWLTGSNFAIRRDAYLKSGGFNPRLNVQEDIDLSLRVSKVGRILFLPNIPVISSGRRFKKGLVKGLLQYGKTFLGLYRRNGEEVSLDDPR